MKNIFSIMILMFLSISVFSQRTVTGKILDESNLPLIGANVIIVGTNLGTITDIDGNFALEVPNDANELIITYTGFNSQTVGINGLNTIDVVLTEGELLDEVVITALGVSRNEKALGYAVQKVSSETISESNAVSAIDALAGAAAGLQVTSASGAAGAASRIVLRGQTSFNGDNQALIVVDGVRMDNSEFHTERSLGGVANSNRAMDINPADIDNISVLKGAAATALYGIEGARGVVLITTKKGKKGDVKVTVGSTFTSSRVTNIVGLQDEYTQGWSGNWAGPSTAFIPSAVSWGAKVDDNLYWVNDPEDPYKWDSNGQVGTLTADEVSAARALGLEVNQFQPYSNVEDFFETGTALQNNISVSGGGESTTYRLSFANLNENGVTPQNTFGRTNIGASISNKAFDDKLSVSISANYAKTGGRRIQQGSNISGVMLGLLRTPISFDNANGLSDPAYGDDQSAYLFADNTQRNFRGGGGYDNPYWVVNNTPFNDEVNRFYGSINASYAFSQWAKLGATLGTDVYTDNRVQRFEIGSRAFPSGRVIEDNYNYRHTDSYFTLGGAGNLSDDFSLSYTVGVNLYDQNLKNSFVTGDGLNFYGFPQLGNTTDFVPGVDRSQIKTAGLFGTADFGFQNFLYLTLTSRRDWSSTLINPNAEFNGSDISVFYPSVSLGLIFSEKIDIPGLSYGKLRASYAEVGGGAPSAYSTATPFIAAGSADGWTNGISFPFKGIAGYAQSATAGNPTLKPSKTRDLELGADLRFFNDLVGLDFTWYDRNSEDQIIAINIPNSTGFSNAFVNSGALKTVGGEVVLTLNPIRKPDFNWNVGFNFSKWKTTVRSLPDGVPNQYLDGFTGTGVYNLAPRREDSNDDGVVNNDDAVVEYYEYGQILGGAFQHVNDTDDNGNPIFNSEMPYNPEGALIIEDNPASANFGFPRVDPVARIVGNPNPDFLLGITNRFSYKGFNLSFLFDIKQGGDIWNGTKGAITFFGTSELTENRGTVTVFDGLKGSTGQANDVAVTLDQNWYTGNGGGFGSVAEHFVEDGSFRRLRFLTLGYDLGDVLGNIGFENVSISVTGRNLFLSTPYTGFDPELSLAGASSNGQGLDYFQLPNTKSYSIGINASF